MLLDNPGGAPGASHEKAQLLSNKTHYNPHDPDARISVKPGKGTKLNYHCSMAVDTAEGRKIGVLGKAGAHKVMLMAAIAFNLKKHLKKGSQKPFQAFFEAIIDGLQRLYLH